ncbi:MAG: glycosyltransferase, partial [Oscillochloris sp.]|nr:glycosyltransferase [Oscillochloris sp.]
MKILFCIDHLRADGTQRVLCQLVAGLAARGHRLTVVCLNDSLDEALVRELCGYGAQLRVVGRRALAGIYGLIGLAWWARAERFDVAVTMLFAADVIGRLVARAAGVPRIVSSIRARNINYRLWQLWLVRATMPLADCVIVNSRASAPFAAAAEGVPPARLLVIPNAIDPAPYARPYPPAELRAQLGLAPGRRLLACVGITDRGKGDISSAGPVFARRSCPLGTAGPGADLGEVG